MFGFFCNRIGLFKRRSSAYFKYDIEKWRLRNMNLTKQTEISLKSRGRVCISCPMPCNSCYCKTGNKSYMIGHIAFTTVYNYKKGKFTSWIKTIRTVLFQLYLNAVLSYTKEWNIANKKWNMLKPTSSYIKARKEQNKRNECFTYFSSDFVLACFI